MAVLQLHDRAQRWWESVTNVLNQSGKDITWDVFRAKFTQEFAPPSYISAKESEFYRLVQGNMTVREYAQQFSALLTYVPHIASSEKGKLKKFLEGLQLRTISVSHITIEVLDIKAGNKAEYKPPRPENTNSGDNRRRRPPARFRLARQKLTNLVSKRRSRRKGSKYVASFIFPTTGWPEKTEIGGGRQRVFGRSTKTW
ncbi:hypothetical protein F511_36907 [Dorcoceras hygrometricum]|uniref:Retrotransposon gag domain-containing protein n=1 Tax=Dorcoceras hygrometricum TaxID=472368 RepID=A0A2Z7CQA9_9LAMI|nr:hypothetical protein F511_36907 [Dorcoceras hygrometricum]